MFGKEELKQLLVKWIIFNNSWFQTFAMFWMCMLLDNSMAHPDMCPVSFKYPLVASMWVIILHSLFLYSDLPLPCHPSSYWLRLFSSQTFSCINTPAFHKPSHSSYLSAFEDGTVCSETSPYKIQMPRNYPEESIQQFLINELFTFIIS